MAQNRLASLFVEQHAVVNGVRQDKAAVASQIDVDDLDIGLTARQIILPRQRAAHAPIADLVMDRIDPHRRLFAVVGDLEETELANEMRAEILQDETLVAEVRPGVA